MKNKKRELKRNFNYELKSFKPKHFTKYYGVRLSGDQVKILKQLKEKYPHLYTSDSYIIRAALNFFIRHKRKGWEL